MDIYEDGDRNVWVATANAGLLRYSPDGRWRAISMTNGLSVNSIRCVDEDSEGNLWVGTDGGGFNRMRRSAVEVWDRRQCLSGEIVRSVAEDGLGSLWVGLNGQGLNRLNGQHFEPVVHPGLVEPTCAPWSILPNRRGGVWLSVGNTGELIHVESQRAKQFPNPEPSRRFYVRSLLEDHEGAIWIGDVAGLTRFKDGQFTIYSERNGFPEAGVHALAETKDGSLYIGTNGRGLVRRVGEKFQVLSKRDGLADERIWSLYPDRDGALWIGTYGAGLARLKNGSVVSLPKAFPVRAVTCLIADHQGSLWAGSLHGIFRTSLEDLNAPAGGKISSVTYQRLGTEEGMAARNAAAARNRASGRLRTAGCGLQPLMAWRS